MIFLSLIILLAFAIIAQAENEKKCWKWVSKTNTVWVDTTGAGHVQMGYLSYLNEAPPYPKSGQPNLTDRLCQQKCDALGPALCAGAQMFYCAPPFPLSSPTCDAADGYPYYSDPKGCFLTWCNFITPSEASTYGAKVGTIYKPKTYSEAGFGEDKVLAHGFYREYCDCDEAHGHDLGNLRGQVEVDN